MNPNVLTSVVDFLPDATFMINGAGEVIAWNGAMEKLTGVGREDILGKGDYAYAIAFYGRRRPLLIDLVRREDRITEALYDFVVRKGDTVSAEGYAENLYNGEGAYIRGTAAVLIDENGAYQGAIESLRDITEQKVIEKRLKDSEQKLRTIYDSVNDGVVVCDPVTGRVIDVNRRMCEMYGCTREEALGFTLADLGAGEPGGSLYRVGAGAPDLVEWQSKDKRGRAFQVEVGMRSALIGRHERLLLTIRDITERKIGEDALHESEERYRIAIESSNDGVAIIQGDTHLYVNRKLVEMFGFDSPADIVGKPNTLFVHPDDVPLVREISLRRQKGMPNLPAYEFKGIKRNGEIINVEVSATAVAYRGAPVSLVYLRDITERKRAEAKLRKETELNKTLIQDSPAFFVALMPDGKAFLMNRSLLDALGYGIDEIAGKDYIATFVPEEEREMLTTIFGRVVAGKDQTTSRHHILTKEGKKRFVEWHGTPVKNDSGDLEYFFGVGIDVTERREAEEALKHREAELEVKSNNLEEVNIALKVLLKQREHDRIELEGRILSNVKALILPYIEKLKRSRLDSSHMTYVGIIETNLNDIISPFLQRMGSVYAHFTPTEIEVANLIKSGKRTKEIGDVLHMSVGAIKFHRNNIRKKLGLNKEKMNLRSYLLSLAEGPGDRVGP